MFSIYIIVLYVVLVSWRPTRKIGLALTPWALFGCAYDLMRLLPNYEVNPIDIQSIYETEKQLFGIVTAGHRMTLNEFFAIHHHAVADVFAGLFYLCWVPVPIGFGLYLYLKGDRSHYLRFSMAFLLVNLVGFIGYYVHPAAPPWYVMNYGFEIHLNTLGNVAGLNRFDELLGLPVFHMIYGNNSNVFAAVPSLHAAYMLATTVYAIISRQRISTTIIFGVICVGIWWTAIYTAHHYLIDVLLGIVTCIMGICLFEKVLLRIPFFSKAFNRYMRLIAQD